MRWLKYALVKWFVKDHYAVFNVEVPYRGALVFLPPDPEMAGWSTERVDRLNAGLEKLTGRPISTVSIYNVPIVIFQSVVQRLP